MRLGWTGIALAVAVASCAAACGEDGEDSSKQPRVPAASDAGTSTEAALCVGGKPTSEYPPGPYEMAVAGTVPDLTFEGVDGPVRVRDFYEPCAARSRLLVVRTSAGWCGPCLWHADNTKKLLADPRFAERVLLLDLLVADEDNMPATAASAARWRDRVGSPGRTAADPAYAFATALLSRAPLPAYVFIDTRTMRIETVADNPDPTRIANRVLGQLAGLDKTERPAQESSSVTDGLFTEDQWALLEGMQLSKAVLPKDPTNEVADDAKAAAFGKLLFADKALSPSGTVSCATCHDASLGLSDGLARSKGVSVVDRNSPSIALAAHARWQFWDGRADTLWMQALGPFEDGKEFGSSRVHVVREVAQRYAAEYGAIFGAKYPLPDVASLPAAGKPGVPAYDALPAADKEKVTRVFVNVGKAIAAFERTLRVKPTAFDRYVAGDFSALTPKQKNALHEFTTVGCTQCHWGPRLTDDAFHNIRFPTGRLDGAPDLGRNDVLSKLAGAEFVATTKWSDAPAAAKVLLLMSTPSMVGAFKTPTLRGLPQTGPYGHGGTFATLLEVSKHYGTRGLEPNDGRAAGKVEEWVPNFDANVQQDLPAFLEVLSAELEP